MEVSKKNHKFNFVKSKEKFVYKSKHLLLELYGCDSEKLNDESFLRCALNNAAKLANAKILNLMSHKFDPQGVTAIALFGGLNFSDKRIAFSIPVLVLFLSDLIIGISMINLFVYTGFLAIVFLGTKIKSTKFRNIILVRIAFPCP